MFEIAMYQTPCTPSLYGTKAVIVFESAC